jgi:trans-aconitate methyltransferase
MPDASDDLDWAGYYRWTAGRAVRPLLARALTTYGEVVPGSNALDLGCGAGVETRALLDAGFDVTAVDAAPESLAIVDRFPEVGSRLTTVGAPMQEVALPTCDLAYAGFALPFCPPGWFDDLWHRLLTSLRPGGLLACDLFGDRDEWAGEDAATMTFVTRDRVTALLEPLDVASLDEVDEEGRAYAGPKHWHRFEVLARRPG